MGFAAIAGLVAGSFGHRRGRSKRDTVEEQVLPLSIGGGVFQTGQNALAQINTGDLIKVARDMVIALRELTKASRALALSVGHFDETTEREASNRVAAHLEELREEIRNLKET